MNTIIFCIPSFTLKNISLQPWLTIYKVSKFLSTKKYDIHVITDVPHENLFLEHITLHFIPRFMCNYGQSIVNKIKEINPKFVVLTVSPCSLFFNTWHKILSKYKTFGFASYPFYDFKNVKKGYFRLGLHDKIQYGKNFLIPDFLWTRSAHNNLYGIICQSTITMQKIHKKSKNRVKAYSILPGIDKNVYNISKKLCIKKTKTTYVYAGSLNKIRGFDLLMDSFKNIKEPGITLKILARGATDRQVNEIRRKILHSSIEIQIVGGWLDKQKFAESISTADITLLPFLLVPSELPVTVMESIELGTPVIVSDIAGLSEAAGPAGILIEPGSLSSLREAIIKIHRDSDLKNRLKEKCLIQREKYLQWDQISQNWLDLLESVR